MKKYSITATQAVAEIAETNALHKYWERRPVGSATIPNLRHARTSREKDFFSEEMIGDDFALFMLSALIGCPTLYLERHPGEPGMGALFYLRHHSGTGPDNTVLKFRKDKLSPRMADELQIFFESECNRKKEKK